MKKRRLAGLLLLAPIAFVAGCGGTMPLSFQANWNSNTSITGLENTFEELVYDVGFTPAPQDGLTLSYEGTFVSTLKNASVKLQRGEQSGYTLDTVLTLSVQFALGDKKSEVFTDSVTTHAEFLSARDKLRPVRSSRKVHSTTPIGAADEIKNCYLVYDYTYDVSYDDELTEATAVYTDLTQKKPEPEERKYELDGKETYLDNEELFFALRGVTPTAGIVFSSLNSVMGTVRELTFREVNEVKVPVDFETANGHSPEQLDGVSVALAYTGKNSGMEQTIVYAKKTSDSENAYRCVPLTMEVPVVQSLGTLQYKLKKATFTAK